MERAAHDPNARICAKVQAPLLLVLVDGVAEGVRLRTANFVDDLLLLPEVEPEPDACASLQVESKSRKSRRSQTLTFLEQGQ